MILMTLVSISVPCSINWNTLFVQQEIIDELYVPNHPPWLVSGAACGLDLCSYGLAVCHVQQTLAVIGYTRVVTLSQHLEHI